MDIPTAAPAAVAPFGGTGEVFPDLAPGGGAMLAQGTTLPASAALDARLAASLDSRLQPGLLAPGGLDGVSVVPMTAFASVSSGSATATATATTAAAGGTATAVAIVTDGTGTVSATALATGPAGGIARIGDQPGTADIDLGPVVGNLESGAGARGGSGDDTLAAGPGDDLLFGGPGFDVAVFDAPLGRMDAFRFGREVVLRDRATGETDHLTDIEELAFPDALILAATVPAFRPLDYIAGYPDLIAAFGVDAEAGWRHFIGNGLAEGRVADGFDGARYLANYPDLRAAFGTDEDAAAEHFIRFGFAEGRTDEALPS